MEFFINYWYVVLIVFILMLLIILGYLVDKEKKNKKVNSIDDVDSFKNDKIETINEFNDKELKIESISDIAKEEPLKEECFIDEDAKDDDLKFEADFSRVIPRKSLFNDDLKKSIDDIKLDPIEINENKITKEDITLPEIEIIKK